MRKKEDVKKTVSPIVEAEGYFLVDVKVSLDDRIEIAVDSVNGIDVDACVGLSRKIDEALDRSLGDFELTVGGAGIGVPFKVPGQYLKNIGNEVDVKPIEGVPFKAVLKNYENDKVTLSVPESVHIPGEKKRGVQYKDIEMSVSDIKQIKDIIKF